MDDHHHNYITKTKPNHKTNKHLFISPTKKTTFPENFPGDMFGKERGLGGQVTATHVPKRHFNTWEPRDVDHGIWIPACEVSNLDWLASWLSVCVPLLRSRSRLLRCLLSFFSFSWRSRNLRVHCATRKIASHFLLHQKTQSPAFKARNLFRGIESGEGEIDACMSGRRQ